MDWTDGYRRKYALLERRISDQFKSKICVFSDSVRCLDGKCPDHHEAAGMLEKACTMTPQLKQKVHREITPSSGPFTPQKLRYIRHRGTDRFIKWKWIKIMGVVISRDVDRYVTELSVECKSAGRNLEHRAVGSGYGI